jgi:hypothetical protein
VRYRQAIAHTHLGKREEALECLADAIRFRPELRERARVEPLLDSLRSEIESLTPPE